MLKVNSVLVLLLLFELSFDNFGEVYVKGKIDIEGKLLDIINIGYLFVCSIVISVSKFVCVKCYFNYMKSIDKKVIQYYYDVLNEFYQLWFDENMVYLCVYFENGDEDFVIVQIKKIDYILMKIQLQFGQCLFDIGCGWGVFVLCVVQKFGVMCFGVMLLQNQFDFVIVCVKVVGFEDRIEICLQDYCEIEGQFDCIMSVGMFEYVGCKNLLFYFLCICELLIDDGIVMNYGIMLIDVESGEMVFGGGEFIDCYVFLDGELLYISFVFEVVQCGGFEVVDVESLCWYYVCMFDIWMENFEVKVEEV